jgi:hypothetical protein
MSGARLAVFGRSPGTVHSQPYRARFRRRSPAGSGLAQHAASILEITLDFGPV